MLMRLMSVLALVPIAAVAQTVASPSSSSGVDALWAYAGTWKTETQNLDTPYSKAGHESATLHNDCWKSGGFVACRQIVNGESKALLVFTCKDEHTCTSYPIPPDGGEPGHGPVLLDGKTWSFPWSVTDGGKTTYFRVVNVWSSATTIEFRREYSTDQAHWTQMATGHEVKVSEK